jgi:hypothetical protein
MNKNHIHASNLQKTYQGKIGAASISISQAIVGNNLDCTITHTVGEMGIDNSGSIKLLWPIVSDAGTPQFSNPNKANFVKISSSNNDLETIGISKSTGFPGKLGTRPWCKGLQLIIKNTDLAHLEQIAIHFSKWKCPSVSQKFFRLKLLIDPFATNKFIEVPN